MPLKKEVKEAAFPHRIRMIMLVSTVVAGLLAAAAICAEPTETSLSVGDVGEFPMDYALRIAAPEPFESGGHEWANGDVCRVPKGTRFEVLNIHPSRAESPYSYGAIIGYRNPAAAPTPAPSRLAGRPENHWLYHECPDGAWLYATAHGTWSLVEDFERRQSGLDRFEQAWELAPR